MSRSNYQNLKEAYLSDIGPIKENYNSPNCAPTTNTIANCSATTRQYNQQYKPTPTWYDWFPNCSQKTFNCPAPTYKLSNWQNCKNGEQIRTVDAVYDGSGQPQINFQGTIMKQPCGTPCVIGETKGVCIPDDTTGRIPCSINSLTYPGKITTTYNVIKPSPDGGSCNIPPNRPGESCNNANGCNIENIVKYFLNTDKAFENPPVLENGILKDSIFTARFIGFFKRINPVGYVGGRQQFLQDMIKYLEQIYPLSKPIHKCKIENLNFLINSMGVSLPGSKIPKPSPDYCRS